MLDEVNQNNAASTALRIIDGRRYALDLAVAVSASFGSSLLLKRFRWSSSRSPCRLPTLCLPCSTGATTAIATAIAMVHRPCLHTQIRFHRRLCPSARLPSLSRLPACSHPRSPRRRQAPLRSKIPASHFWRSSRAEGLLQLRRTPQRRSSNLPQQTCQPPRPRFSTSCRLEPVMAQVPRFPLLPPPLPMCHRQQV